MLEAGETIDRLVDGGSFSGGTGRRLARIGLANYFAGALILPYRVFLGAAERYRYDITRLSAHFDVGFETVCHRLSTLQRRGTRGVPFAFVRVDRAGNISKRQSATPFHFSRVGGSCPLWVVYEAFSSPGRIVTQIAELPDGKKYFWLARTVHRNTGGYGDPGKTFAIGLGCELRHARRLPSTPRPPHLRRHRRAQPRRMAARRRPLPRRRRRARRSRRPTRRPRRPLPRRARSMGLVEGRGGVDARTTSTRRATSTEPRSTLPRPRGRHPRLRPAPAPSRWPAGLRRSSTDHHRGARGNSRTPLRARRRRRSPLENPRRR